MFRALTNAFDFHGRASRSEYWMFVLLLTLLGIFQFVLAGIVLVGSLDGKTSPAAAIMALVSLGVALFLFTPSLSVTIRRLHDTNRSGWWLLLLVPGSLVSVTNGVIASGQVHAYMTSADSGAAAWQGLISSPLFPMWIEVVPVASLIGGAGSLVIFVFLTMKGTDGPNRFDAAPRPLAAPEDSFIDLGAADTAFCEPVLDMTPAAAMTVQAPRAVPPARSHSVAASATFGKRR